MANGKKAGSKKGKKPPEDEQETSDEGMTPFVDSYLVCDSGRRFPAIRGVLARKSRVMQDLLTSCSQEPQGSPNPVEVPLVGESDKDAELLWKLWHGKLQLFNEFLNLKQPALLPQTLKRITCIARLADKYQSTGQCTH